MSKTPSVFLSDICSYGFWHLHLCSADRVHWWNPACLDLLSLHIHSCDFIHSCAILYTPSITVNMSGAKCDYNNLIWVTDSWTFQLYFKIKQHMVNICITLVFSEIIRNTIKWQFRQTLCKCCVFDTKHNCLIFLFIYLF